MARELTVRFTATFETKIVVVGDDDCIEDALTDIDIPETESCQYVPDQFNVISVKDENGKRVHWQTLDLDGFDDNFEDEDDYDPRMDHRPKTWK
jgi:hypothetical protein